MLKAVIFLIVLMDLISGRADQQSPTKLFVTPDELQAKDQWVRANLIDPKATPPFSFTYGGLASDKLLSEWGKTAATRQLDPNRRQYDFTWNDLPTGLEVHCVAVEYTDYPAVEWTVTFKNTGTQDTPILENIQRLDTTFTRASSESSGFGAYDRKAHEWRKHLLNALRPPASAS